MPDYTKFKRGSEWRKWDLHLHTPETKKNDQFEGTDAEEKWQKYVDTINNSAEEISVVGITDYFCIDNYFKFKNLANNGTITKRFDLILPNIEIRVTPVTGSSTPINLHCIFNPLIELDIESRFLGKLKFTYGGSDYSAKKDELIRLGRDLPNNKNLDELTALKAGLSQYVVSIDVVRGVFEKDTKLRENTIIAVSNKSTDGASGIRKHADFFVSSNQSQLDATRWSIYQFSDAVFSSSESDVLYFTALGPDNKDAVIDKCGTLMPCFHGCDAHDNGKIFKPDQNRFCWIKADPTFEGLKQTLYEPSDRVRIAAICPDIKNERFVISDLQFFDSGTLFKNEKIYLNENLNAIIGGKSSGKSLLLYSTAKSIDPDQVSKASQRLGFDGYKFDSSFNVKVTWKNGDTDILNDVNPAAKLHKITYIPQLYINYLVEKNNKEELNTLIKNILLQDAFFKSFYEEKIDAIKRVNIELEKLLVSYLQIRNKAIEIANKSKELGKSEAISKGIVSLEKAISNGQKSSNLNEEQFAEYNRLIGLKLLKENAIKLLDEKKSILTKVATEIISVKGGLFGTSTTSDTVKGEIDRILDELTVVPPDVTAIRLKLEADYGQVVVNLEKEVEKLKMDEERKALMAAVSNLDQELKPFFEKIAGQSEIQKLTTKLDEERDRHNRALNLEKQYATLLADYQSVRNQTVTLLKSRILLYKEIVSLINSTKTEIGPEISMTCNLLVKKEKFLLFGQANKAAIPSNHYFETLFNNEFVNYELVPELYLNQLRVSDDKLIVSHSINIPLRQKVSLENVLRGLVMDIFELDYTVTYKGDDLLNMSPGKKGTVLLILFLQISSSEYPILIDQPEDNLDNRTIYDLLCTMIKKKKKERQIIIVSHNANLVVATDTENIIVANQEGQGATLPPGIAKFQYVNGSLEHTFPVINSISSVLHCQGIKEHVTDILEGGDEAFKQRERKYSIK